MDAYALRRYYRNAPVGACLSRERLLLGLRNVCWKQSQHESAESLQRWIQALGEEFGLSPAEQRYLRPENMPSLDGKCRRLPSWRAQASPRKMPLASQPASQPSSKE